ncbi:transcriptional regulator [Pseudonocardia sp. NPDC049635]|uniref:transcriptional regulator n=1 Tax=Pseudonocardia sp. NPDC049635 TaxID=3155506 RepID=UPI0033EE1812
MPDPTPDTRLVPLLLDPTRLRISATLVAAGEVEFGFVRDRVGLSDSALSKQLKVLTTAGIVESRREPTGAARRSWVRLTTDGRAQVSAHILALREIAAGGERP